MNAEDNLTKYYQILSLHGLSSLLKNLKEEFLDKGLLVEIEGDCTIEELLFLLENHRNLPDIINITFETVPLRTRYILSCDTFHGNGVFRIDK